MISTASRSRPVTAAWTISLCVLAAMVEGFDLQSMGVAAPTLGPALRLTRAQMGPVFSASIFGLLVGSMLLGRWADLVGRKRPLLVSLCAFGVFSIATAFATGFSSLLIVRVLTGLGLGGALPNFIAIAAEAVAPGRRTGLVTAISAGMPFGGALAALVAAGTGWRQIFLCGGIAPLLVALLMLLAVPESAEFRALRHAQMSAPPKRTGVIAALFGEGRSLTTLMLWSSFFCILLVLYLLLNWLPTLMASRGISRAHASVISVLFNLGGGLGALLIAAILDRSSRTALVGGFYAGMVLSLSALALVRSHLVLTGLMGLAAGFFVAAGPLLLYGLAPEFYETSIRGTGVGAAVAVGRIGAVVGPLFAAALLSSGASAARVLLAAIPFLVVAGMSALILLRRPAAAS